MISNVFVYGTLKQGEERAPMWPFAPQSIQPAYTVGILYDLGPYPAMRPGPDRVLGELWQFLPHEMPHTLAVLDDVESVGLSEPDLYIRQAITCWTFDHREHQAYTYYLARAQLLASARRIEPDADGYCRWLRRGTQ